MVDEQTCSISQYMDTSMRPDDWQNQFHTFITQETAGNIAKWVTRHCVYFKNHQTLLVTLRTRNQPRGESCVFVEVVHLFLLVGRCVKQTSDSHFGGDIENLKQNRGTNLLFF